MHVIVVGCGRVGSGLAVLLTEGGHSVAILDKSARAFRRLPDTWPGVRILGSGFDRDDLEEAGAIGADALTAVTSGDNTNILTARIARETYHIPHVVARIYDPRRAEIYQRLGIPTVATVRWTIDQVYERLFPEVTVKEWTDPSGRLVLLGQDLAPGWAGRNLSELNVAGAISVVAVTRAGIPRLDPSELVGQEGDIVHAVVLRSHVDQFRQLMFGNDVVQPDPDGGQFAQDDAKDERGKTVATTGREAKAT